MKLPLLVSLFACTSVLLAQESKLPRLDVFGAKGGKRQPLGYEGTPLDPKKSPKTPEKAKGQTEITSNEVTFDQATHQAVFIGNVMVKDPDFTVTCDRLTAILKSNKGEPKNEPANTPPPAEPSPGKRPIAAGADPKGGGLERAIAEATAGREVVITQDKIESDGSITKNVGRARKATYDSKTGNIILVGSPSVQQGINLCVAQSEDTVMTLNRNGYNRVDGPSKTVIKDASASDATR